MKELFHAAIECTEVNGFRQREMHIAEPVLPEPIAFEFVLDIEKIIGHKTHGFDQIRAELIEGKGKNNSLRDP